MSSPASCPKRSACALTDSISMKEALKVWQSFYCDGCFTRCERFKLATAGISVPGRLLPNGRLQDMQEQPFGPIAPAATRAA